MSQSLLVNPGHGHHPCAQGRVTASDGDLTVGRSSKPERAGGDVALIQSVDLGDPIGGPTPVPEASALGLAG